MKGMLIGTLAAALGVFSYAGEQPKKDVAQMSPKQVKKFFTKVVNKHVKDSSAKTEGSFVIHDEVLHKNWKLKLRKIHTQKIVSLGSDRYFACADLDEVGAKTPVDLDFYVAKSGADWAIEKVIVHKVEGKPRFLYNDKNEVVPAN